MERSALLTVFLLTISYTASYPVFQDQIPNGNNVPHPCKANYIWHGVGHKNPLGGGVRNPFGLDFEVGKKWTTDLCKKDSDMDGKTNGEELGDPDCTWTPGTLPKRVDRITHPGVCDPMDSSLCKGKNDWIDCEIEDGLKDCDGIHEAGVFNQTVTIPKTVVPAQETTYMCMAINLPQDRPYHLVAHEPVIDNKQVLHHILLQGCDPMLGAIPDNELYKVQPCIMGNQKCMSLIGGWTVGSPGKCIEKSTGYLIGPSAYRQAIIQFHWNNPYKRSDYTDASGLRLYFTPNLRPTNAGVLVVGQRYLEIPPGQTSLTTYGRCTSDCSKMILKGPVNIFLGGNHMHYLGHEMRVDLYRKGMFHSEITNDAVFNYDSPTEFTYSSDIQVLPGDEIVTKCVYKSTSRLKTAFFGEGTADEMCYGFLSVYPIENVQMPVCVAWKNISTCDLLLTKQHNGCKFNDFANYSNPNTKAVVDSVLDNCSPFGICRLECLSKLQELIVSNTCMSGEVSDLIRQSVLQRKDSKMLEFIAAVDSCKTQMLRGSTTGGASQNEICIVSSLLVFLIGKILLSFV